VLYIEDISDVYSHSRADSGDESHIVGLSVTQCSVAVPMKGGMTETGEGLGMHSSELSATSVKLTFDGGITVGRAPPSPRRDHSSSEDNDSIPTVDQSCYILALAGPGFRAALGVSLGCLSRGVGPDDVNAVPFEERVADSANRSSIVSPAAAARGRGTHCYLSGGLSSPWLHFVGLPSAVPVTPDGSDDESVDRNRHAS